MASKTDQEGSKKTQEPNSEVKVEAKKEEKTKAPPKQIGFFALFRYATGAQKAIIFVSFIFAIAHGLMMPVFSVIFGRITEDFTPDKTDDQIEEQAKENSLIMLGVGGIAFIAAGLGVSLWKLVGARITETLKKKYFQKILEQEIGWFDVENPEKLTTNYTEEFAAFQKGCGTQVHIFLFSTSMSIGGIAVGFYIGWLYSLYILLTVPLVFAGMGAFVAVQMKSAQVTKQNYANAGAMSEQALSSIKTVYSLSGQAHEAKKYSDQLVPAKKAAIKFGMIAAFCFGVFFFVIIAEYGLGYWIGAQLIKKGVYNGNEGRDYNAVDVVSIFFAVITGAFALGQVGPSLGAITKAREAGYHIYRIIERTPPILIDDKNAKMADEKIKGDIEFNNVTFRYPSRDDIVVLNNLSFKIKAGQKAAFVGETGCGKSTTIQLVERYYDANQGQVSIDGTNIKDYNLKSLRRIIGYVGQEPKLFAMSIKENLLIAKPDATETEMVDALKMANAYSFVMNLEKKLDTYVGDGGSQLSGGQKQRIAIARSALQNPRILLLDESTSALDRQNERSIQKTLDQFSENRTTITIAHRLSTIINSDVIFVLDKGFIVEQGTHTELLSKNGAYTKLVQNQLQTVGGPKTGTQNDGNGAMKDALNSNPEQVSNDANFQEVEHQAIAVQKKQGDSDEPNIKHTIHKKVPPKGVFSRLSDYMGGGNKGLLVFGSIFSLINGAILPFFAVFLADMIEVFAKYEVLKSGSTTETFTTDDLNSDVNRIALSFVVIAFVSLAANFVQLHVFNSIGQTVTFNLRIDLFNKLLHKTMAFFDKEEHNPGLIASKLGSDCLIVNAIVSSSIGAILQGIGSLLGGIIIAFFASWRLAILGIIGCPMIVLTGIIESKMMMQGSTEEEKKDAQLATDVRLFQESATNMRTVSAINCQVELNNRYERVITRDNKNVCKGTIVTGLLYGFGQSAMFIVYAGMFYAGALFTTRYGLSFRDLFRALFAIIFAAYGAGMAQQFLPDMGSAFKSAKSIFEIIDYKNEIEYPKNGKKTEIKGRIELKNVYFKYPGRETPVFENLSLTIQPNQKVAFAGPSGTGKSTIFSLLLRFYDIQQGEILVDGVDIKEYDIDHLRHAFGMVGQEPKLFNSTINYNIK